MAARRFLVPLSLCLAAARAFLVVPPQSVLKAGDVVSIPAPFFSSPPAMQQGGRTKGALFSLVINPKRQGISQLGIEEIKAKKALLMAPSDLQGAVLVSGSLEEEVFTLLNEQRVWNRITAFAADAVSARKRLTSRATRYSGVLDMLNLEEGDPHDLGVLESYLSSKPYSAWLDLSPEDADETRLLAKAKLAAATGIKFFVTAVSMSQARLEKQDLDLEAVEKGMVKKIVGDILEEEYDDMYYSMRTKEDLDLYKKANWQRAVNLVLGMLMGKGEEAGGRDKASQRLTGFQDPYLGPQWHIIRSNAAVMIKIKELHDEIGERLTKEDWERYDILEGDFMGDEEAVMTMKIEEKTKRNKDYLRETLIAPPRRKASLIVEVDEIDSYRTALLESGAGRKGALPSPAADKEEVEARSVVVEVVDEGGKEGEELAVAAAPTKRGRKRKTAEGEE
ncbi:Hypothetical protein NocV09_10700070 [Nannochloropsis oceanica]